MPNKQTAFRTPAFRMWRDFVFFLLPVLGYLLFACLANRYAGDLYHKTAAAVFRYAAIAVDAVFPYLSVGLVCTVVAQSGFAGNGATVLWGLAAQLLPYLCEIAKNYAVSPSVRAHFGAYLESAAVYTVLNYLMDALLFALLVILAFVYHRKCKKSTRLVTALVTVAAVFLTVALVLNIMDTVDFVREQLYEYYNPITAKTVFEIALTYLKEILTAALCFGLTLVQAHFLCRKK